MLGTPHHLKHVDQLMQNTRIFEEFLVLIAGSGLLSLHLLGGWIVVESLDMVVGGVFGWVVAWVVFLLEVVVGGASSPMAGWYIIGVVVET